MEKFTRKSSLAAAAVLLATLAARGQSITTGEISGHVSDATGAAVGGATVTLSSDAQGTKRVVTTDKQGDFRFSLLRPGTYSINEEGMNLFSRVSGVEVGVGQVTPVTLVATPGGESVTVEVNGSTEPLLQTESGSITTTFGLQQMQDLPFGGGDISMVPLTTQGAVLNTGGGLSSNFFVFGIPGTSNLFTLNGADLMDPFYNINNSGASNNTIGSNEIENVSVVVNGYGGQYGRLPGANVNYTTKGGSNQFHGSLKYQYNASAFNARDWFVAHNGQSNPRTVSQLYGADISGPIFKDKLFFYFDDEGLRYVSSEPGAQVLVPSQPFQTAVLANIAANQPAELAYYKQMFGLYNAANGASAAVANNGTQTSDPTLGCQDFTGFTGSTRFGAGGAPCNNVYTSKNNSLNTEQFYAIRIDQNLGSKDKVFYRYKHDFGIQATATDPINNVFSANSVQPEWEGQLNETHVFSPDIINNLTLAGSYYKAIFGPASIGAALAVFPTTVQSASFNTLGGSDNSYPSGRNVAQYQIVDDVSYTHGRNSYKAGVNFRRNLFSNFANQPGTSGLTNFASTTDFANGVISNTNAAASAAAPAGQVGGSSVAYSFPTGGPIEAKFYSLGIYVQDVVKATDQFTITASLRLDRNSNPACRTACFTRLVGPFGTIPAGAAVPYNQSIKTGQYNPYSAVEGVTIQPRMGFAYAPRNSDGLLHGTVIRGGVGVFADSPVLALTSRFLTAAPSDPAFTLQNVGTFSVFAGAPGSAYSALNSSNKAFQTGFTGGQTLAQIQAAVTATGSAFAPPSYTASVTNKLLNPKYVEYNLDIQRSLGKSDVLDVAYVGNCAFDVFFQNPTGNAYAKKADGFGGLGTAAPDPRFTYVTTLNNNGHSNYSGASVGYRHQARYGLTFGANYTLGHALGNISNGGLYGSSTGVEGDPLTQIDPFSVDRLNYSALDYDVRHSFNVNYVWDIHTPFRSSALKQILGGFTVSGIAFAKSGAPFSVYNSSAKTAEVGTSSNGVVLAALLPGMKQNTSCANFYSTCLTKAMFATAAQQAAYGFGNVPLNSFRGPSFVDTDLTATKNIAIHERYKLKLGATAYNVLNHPNFAPPTNSVTSGSFGKITSTVVSSPSSLYGNGQGSAPSGRVLALTGALTF